MAVSENGKNKLEKEMDPDGFSSIKVALSFCALGLLAAVVLVPTISSQKKQVAGFAGDGVDKTTTASISKSSKPSTVKRYTVRKSVLHRDPTASCIIKPGDEQKNEC